MTKIVVTLIIFIIVTGLGLVVMRGVHDAKRVGRHHSDKEMIALVKKTTCFKCHKDKYVEDRLISIMESL